MASSNDEPPPAAASATTAWTPHRVVQKTAQQLQLPPVQLGSGPTGGSGGGGDTSPMLQNLYETTSLSPRGATASIRRVSSPRKFSSDGDANGGFMMSAGALQLEGGLYVVPSPQTDRITYSSPTVMSKTDSGSLLRKVR